MDPELRVVVIGCGHAGLPVVVALAKQGVRVQGYDIDVERVRTLAAGLDTGGLFTSEDLSGVKFTHDASALEAARCIIVAVPTPSICTQDGARVPDLSRILKASEQVGRALKSGDTVVYESTVFPGCTEDVCAPVLEQLSGLVRGKDYQLCYAPERINPGDQKRGLKDIVRIVSGCNAASLDFADALYSRITPAGTHRASSIRVAEASKLTENVQRDVNIALMNELARVYSADGIEMAEVISAASTKWNFARYSPGLVGGECIAVDPHYLIDRAKQLKVPSPLVVTARATNDAFAHEVGRCCHAVAMERLCNGSGKPVAVLVLGLTYKPDVSDPRESRSFDVVRALRECGATVDAIDPRISEKFATSQLEACGARFCKEEELLESGGLYDVVLLTVAHKNYLDMGRSGLARFLHRSPTSFIADPFRALKKEASAPSVRPQPSPKGSTLLGVIEVGDLFAKPSADAAGAPEPVHAIPAPLSHASLTPNDKQSANDTRKAVLVVGYGRIGGRHAAIAAIHPSFSVVGICDTDPTALRQAARDHPDTPLFSNATAALAACGGAIVAICVPNDLHAELAIQALGRGHHVIVEKPLALASEAGRKVSQAAKSSGCRVFSVMQNRYSPTSVWLKEMVESGRLGQVRMVQMNCFWNRSADYFKQSAWRGTVARDGGPLYTQFSHFLDLLLWTLGDISDIRARFANMTQNCECEDAGSICFNIRGGGIGTFAYATCAYKRNVESSITLLCERGNIKVGGQYMERVELCDVEDYTMPKLPPAEPPNNYGTYTGSAAAHHFVYENVEQVLSGERIEPNTSTDESLQLVSTIERAYLQRPQPLLAPQPDDTNLVQAPPARVDMVDIKKLNARHGLSVASLAPSVEGCRFVLGPNVSAFEGELSAWLGGAHVLGVGCGTDALTMAMMALGLKPGDEVITPSHTFVAAVEAIVRMGCIPVYVDVDDATFLMDANGVRAAATEGTKAVIVVHLYGQTCEMQSIVDVCAELGLKLIEDTAQALGSVCTMGDGRIALAGTIGDIGTTSFYPSKPLGAWGDGGACFTFSDELNARLRAIRNHGITRKRYEYEIVGVNSRLDDLQACVLRKKLPFLKSDAEVRASMAKLYNEKLAGLSELTTPTQRVGSSHVYHQYTIKVGGGQRDALASALAAQNIASCIYYPVSNHLQEAFSSVAAANNSCRLPLPVTEKLQAEVLSLPMHAALDANEVAYVADAVRAFFATTKHD